MNSKSKRSLTTKKSSPSRKSDSTSNGRPKYRLKRTLKRYTAFHQATDEDRRYIWASYKLGAFGHIENPTKEDFDRKLALYAALNDIVYIVEAESPKGKMPVGMVGGRYLGPILWLSDVTWFPWSSDRNRYESTINLLNELRRQYVVVFTHPKKDEKFFLCVARHGVTKRIGTLLDVTDEGLYLFQTRSL